MANFTGNIHGLYKIPYSLSLLQSPQQATLCPGKDITFLLLDASIISTYNLIERLKILHFLLLFVTLFGGAKGKAPVQKLLKFC